MKKFIFLFLLPVALAVAGQTAKQIMPSLNYRGYEVPAAVLTDDSTWWTLSASSGTGYVNEAPGAYYNNSKTGGGIIMKLRFTKTNRFEFILYMKHSNDTETRIGVEGEVKFFKDSKGQSVFVTKAQKGTYRFTKNGNVYKRAIPSYELRGEHSNTYLWEKTRLPYDAKHIYLLMVDLDANPTADISNPETIDPAWISKFHISVKNKKH